MNAPRIVSVHQDVSQVDDAVFAAWDDVADRATIDLIFWNGYGFSRDRADPELGLVPKFPAFSGDSAAVRRIWLDRRVHQADALLRAILERAPALVLLNDLGVRDKFGLALRLRARGVKTAFRSDKNPLSQGARAGLGLALERLAYGVAFDVFCPCSRLAVDYYAWPARKPAALFPYATDLGKFSRPADDRIRRDLRRRLSIPDGAPTLLCVAKFVEREGVDEVLRAYLALRERRGDAFLIVVGSGPQKDLLHGMVEAAGAGTHVRFTGYVPFAELQDYFFAADVFVHLARCEPWGVSVTDALCAGLGVVTTEAVGAGLELLTGDLRRYVTPTGDVAAAASAFERLFDGRDIAEEFRPAHQAVAAEYSNVATALRLARLGG